MNQKLLTGNYRLAVISDIHGNLTAFDAVISALNSFAPIRHILVAGDMVGGPHDDVILRRLHEMEARMVLGNNEVGILDLDRGTAPSYHYTAKQFSLLRWCWKLLSPEMLALLHTTPLQHKFELPGCAPIFVVHGSPRNVWELVNPYENRSNFEDIVALTGDPVIIFGHTHRAWHLRWNGRMAMNPGAVSIPEGEYTPDSVLHPDLAGARFAVLEWDGEKWAPEFHFVTYDLQTMRRANEESGFLADAGSLARVFMLDTLTGKPVWVEFFKLARQLSKEIGVSDLPYIPDDVWDQTGDQFPWQDWE